MPIFRSDYNQQQPSSGKGFRLILGIIIAVVGIFMFWNQKQENPVTGEKQHVNISTSREIKLGLDAAPLMTQKMGGELPDSDPRVQTVQRLGNFLVKNSIAAKSPWDFHFHLLADQSTVNAFALPGGQIFITLGLYSKLQNEAQLAGVLSHEMGHVIERHSAQQMAKSDLGNMILTGVAVAASDEQSRNNYAIMIASVVNQVVQLRYSRHDESQADIWGLKIMSQAGFNPRAMIDVMNILKASGGKSHMPEFFQTHPNPDLRIQQIEEYLKQNPASDKLTNGNKL